MLIKITYFNERTTSLEVFETIVFILPKTPIDIIIGRKTIKQQRLTITAPSHFEDRINLTDNVDTTTEFFGYNKSHASDNKSQELLYGATPLNRVGSKGPPFKAHAHLINEAHTCISNLKSDDNTADFRGLTGKTKSVKQNDNSNPRHPL
jgi:hypothetical protein